MSATVYLVGAGPGDPDLLTRKALRLIQDADVILHDDLIPLEILKLAREDARIQNVGKRCGQKRITQQEIHTRMIADARAEKMVIRLQSGDPLVYGRAGEEIEALRNAGINFEVVPGVTAAFAAAASAKIALTEKRVASRVIFLSAHSCKKDALPDLGSGVSSDSTLAIYMPGQDYAHLQKQLLASGIPSTAPCLVVCRASQPGESLHATFLGRLALAHPAAAPSILFVGALAGVLENYSHQATSEIAFVS